MGDSLYATSRSFCGAATISSSISKSSCKMQNEKKTRIRFSADVRKFGPFLAFHICMTLININYIVFQPFS